MPKGQLKLHPCWECHAEMYIEEQSAGMRFVCPRCKTETHFWLSLELAERERQSRFEGTSKRNEGEEQ